MKDLSILIPARNEEYLKQTIEDIEKHKEADTEVLWEEDIIPIGQRALTNKLARKSEAKFLMKLDAHCAFSQGFDRIMIEQMEENMVMTPMLCRLDVKNWQIIPKPFTKKYYFDTNLVFRYFTKEQSPEWGLVETMALQGSCFMVSRENYWKWNICDESYGSWGFQGIETACKTWFNGGRVVTNTNAFYGHLFRGIGQNVTEIPYVRTKEEIEQAKQCAQKLLKHPKMPWLIEKFNYPGDWSKEKVKELCT